MSILRNGGMVFTRFRAAHIIRRMVVICRFSRGETARRGRERIEMSDMTDEQVENWRKILYGMFGPVALLCPREQIVAYRDHFQAQLDAGCDCDPKRHGYTKHQDGSIECNNCHKPRQPQPGDAARDETAG
jgi:hypothetical protein